MMVNLIVLASILFGVIFFVCWLVRPDLRAWIERPKYRFQLSVQSYDQIRHGDSGSKGSRSA